MQGPSTQFVFPISLKQLEYASSPQVAKEAVLAQAYLQDRDISSIKYRVHLHKNKYCYLRCSWKGCRSSLHYCLEENEMWRLTKANCHHQHTFSKMRNFKFQAVLRYIQSLPASIPTASIKKVVCSQFGISPKQFYYLLAKKSMQPMKPSILAAYLEEKGFQIFMSEQERPQWQPPELFLATSKQMKALFREYGDLVSFDLSYNLIKNEHPSGKKWKVGCFLGTSSTKRIVPLAFVVSLQDTKEAYVQILRTFCRAMGGQPKVLVTDQERAIHAAIMELKENGEWDCHHLFDAYHILHNVRKKLKKKEQIVLFSRMLHARNRSEFAKRLQEARSQLHNEDQHILQNFNSRSHLFCFSQIQPVFFAFCASSSPNQCFHSVLKRSQTSEKEFSITIRSLTAVISQLLQQRNRFQADPIAYEKIFSLPELKIIRSIFSKNILTRFIEELAKSIQSQAVDANRERVIILQHRQHYAVNFTTEEKWHCSCLFIEKTKLPCRHLLKVIISKGLSIMDYIPDRWIAKDNQQPSIDIIGKPRSKRGRQRASSRPLIL